MCMAATTAGQVGSVAAVVADKLLWVTRVKTKEDENEKDATRTIRYRIDDDSIKSRKFPLISKTT